jgi:hypothetical protein
VTGLSHSNAIRLRFCLEIFNELDKVDSRVLQLSLSFGPSIGASPCTATNRTILLSSKL